METKTLFGHRSETIKDSDRSRPEIAENARNNRQRIFDYLCARNGAADALTRSSRPTTSSPAER